MSTWRLNPRLIAGGTVLAFMLIVALAAPVLAPFDPSAINAARALLPAGSGPNLLGTDEFGRDVLSRSMYGARVSLAIALAATALSGLAGTLAGMVSAYYGRWIDALIMRSMDLVLAFPAILLAIAIVAFFGNSLSNLTLAVALLYMPGVARTVSAAADIIRRRDFVESAQAIGASDPYIMRRVILPNIAGPLTVRLTLNIGSAILIESGLSFLGLGPPPPAPTWGGMVAAARAYLEIQPGYAVWPSLAVAVAILAVNTLGDGLQDHLDPRLRKA